MPNRKISQQGLSGALKAFATAAALTVGVSMAHAEDSIRIGLVAPLSGPLAKLGQETVIGAEIAAELVNESGGINGKKIELVTADTPTPDQAKSQVERLVTQEGLKVITGNYGSSLAIASSTTAVRYGAFYWEQSSASYDIAAKAMPYSLKVPWGTYELAVRFADVVENVFAPKLNKGAKDLKIAVVHEDSSYGSEAIRYIEEVAKEKGFNLSFVQAYNAASTTDFTPVLLRLKQAQPDVLVAISYLNDAVKFQQQLKEQDVYVPAVIGLTAGYGQDDFARTLGKAADDIFIIDANPFLNPEGLTPQARELTDAILTRFEKRQGRVPASHAIYSFLGSWVLYTQVLAKIDSLEPDAILEQAMSLDMPFGSLPMGFGIKFTPEDSPRPHYNERGLPILNQWRDGKYVPVYPPQFAVGEIRGLPLPQWSER